MKEEYQSLELVKDENTGRFEMRVGEYLPFIEYTEKGEDLVLLHTEVPPELEGKGVGTAIIEKTLQYILKNNYNLVPLCPFVIAYINRHPEWKTSL